MSRSSIAEVLKNKRKALNMSASEVVARLNMYGIEISPKSLYSYESGHRQPDADTLMALCEIYEITNPLLSFGYKKEKPADTNTGTSELTENERIFMSLPSDLRQEALRYMRYLAEQEGKL